MNFWTFLLFATAFQGVSLAVALLLPSRERAPRAALAGLLLVFAAHLVEFALIRQGRFAYDDHRSILFITTPLAFLVGPFFHVYVAELRSRRFGPTRALHFAPAALVAMNFLPTLRHIASNGIPSTPMPAPGPIVWIHGYALWAAHTLHALVYLVLGWRSVRRFERESVEDSARSDLVHAIWLRRFALALLAATSLQIVAMTVMILSKRHVSEVELGMALVLALLVQGAGFVALRRPECLARPYATPAAALPPHATMPRTPPPAGPVPDPPRYAKSGLTAERLARYRERLVEVMQRDQPYLDENLRLADLARAAGIPPAHLSQVFSQEIGESFFDFVNSYRIEQVKRGLLDASSPRSVLEVALAAGFSSKSSFNRIFKQRTGVTPSEWVALNATSAAPAALRDHARRPSAPSVGSNPGSSPLG